MCGLEFGEVFFVLEGVGEFAERVGDMSFVALDLDENLFGYSFMFLFDC